MAWLTKLWRYLWYRFGPLNSLRCLGWRCVIRFAPLRWPAKLHVGCGLRRKEGYLNIDQTKTPATDMVLDIRRLPFRPASFDVIESYHVIEHIGRNDIKGTLSSWAALLKEGGTMVIECPDFDQAARDYLAGNTERLNNIFGLQRYRGDTHLFGYNFERLKRLLEECGFKDVRQGEPTDYHKANEPCLRVECRKEGEK